MPELRKDPITGRWVIISTERRKRPDAFRVEHLEPIDDMVCPFCEGHEEYTPREVLSYRRNGGAANGPGWDVRVVPNKFPALQVEGELDRQGEGLFDKMNGIGAHEVIIETPDHKASLATLPATSVERVLWAFRERVLDLKQDKRFRYILIFKNHGAAAGASLDHTHSQLIALPGHPAQRARRDLRRAAALPAQGTLRLLRHRPAGAGSAGARDFRERRLRRAVALRPAVPVRDVAPAEAPRVELRGGAAPRVPRRWRGS